MSNATADILLITDAQIRVLRENGKRPRKTMTRAEASAKISGLPRLTTEQYAAVQARKQQERAAQREARLTELATSNPTLHRRLTTPPTEGQLTKIRELGIRQEARNMAHASKMIADRIGYLRARRAAARAG